MKTKILIIVIIIILIATGIYFFNNKDNQTSLNTLYKTDKYDFSLTLPAGWKTTNDVFYSLEDQEEIATHEKTCGSDGCEGAYYTPGVYIFNPPANNSWLPVINNRSKVINGIVWTINEYDGSGLGIIAYETEIGGIKYGFWDWYSDFQKKPTKMDQLLGTFKPYQTNTNEITNWKTYTNTEYGFEFKYPTTQSVQKELVADLEERYGYNLLMKPIDVVMNIRKTGYSSQDDGIGYSPSIIIKQQNTKVGAIDIQKFVMDEYSQGPKEGGDGVADFVQYKFSNNNLDIVIYLHNASEEENFDEILSTFKFTQ